MKNIALFLILFFLTVYSYPKDIKSIPVTFHEPEIMGIELITDKLDMGMVDPFKGMKEIPSAIKLRVKSNVDWVLYVMVMNDFTDEKGDRIPCNRFEIRTGGGKYHPLKNGEMYRVASRGDNFISKDGTISIDVMFKLKMDDSPGNYFGNLNFILERNF